MTISLVSGPLLGFDLVRHPRGFDLAATLLWGIGLTPADLSRCAAAATAADAGARNQARRRVSQLQAGRRTAARSAAASVQRDPNRSMSSLVQVLRASLIIDYDDLVSLLRKDILDWAGIGSLPGGGTPAEPRLAAELLTDALAADWFTELDEPSRTILRAPVLTAAASVGRREPDIGPCQDEVAGVLDTLRRLDANGRLQLRTANTNLGVTGPRWPELVHEASWAALTTGRIRAAASAQLLAAQAFLAGGLDAADGAEGVWNLISGHLQAAVVADILPSHTQLELGHGWQQALALS